jgi:hypothetical protein
MAENEKEPVAEKMLGDVALVGRQVGRFPPFGVDTMDCLGDYDRIKAPGVKFQGESQVNPWGPGVLLKDLYGNKLYISR